MHDLVRGFSHSLSLLQFKTKILHNLRCSILCHPARTERAVATFAFSYFPSFYAMGLLSQRDVDSKNKKPPVNKMSRKDIYHIQFMYFE